MKMRHVLGIRGIQKIIHLETCFPLEKIRIRAKRLIGYFSRRGFFIDFAFILNHFPSQTNELNVRQLGF